MLETFKEKKTATSVIDTATIKKRRVLLSTDYAATKFISVDFCQLNEKLLVTLGDDARIVVWQYDKQKAIATEIIQLTSPQSQLR
jgi:WD40 repeat protein